MSIANRIEELALLTPIVTAARIARDGLAPSFKRLAGDEFELTTSAADSAAALEELARLDPDFDWSGYTAELVEAKADPAAWHRDQAFDADGHKMPAVTRPVVRKRYIIRRAVPETEHAALVRYVLTRKAAKPAKVGTGGAFVVCLADLQIGKVDRNGGTPELLDALGDKLAQAWALARKAKPAEIIILDPGDILENIQNIPAQAYTNDRSLTEQVDLASAITVRAITDAATIAPVRFAAVPSNHGQLRRGFKAIGKPSDDFGILNARTSARVFAAAGRDDVQVIIPETYAESLTIDVDGLPIGLVHGHQTTNPDRMPEWWAGQTFGGQPLAAARILVSGHYHSTRVQTVGDGKLWIQCPSMDGGSSWFTNLRGDESPRGLLTFQVAGGQMDCLRVL